MRRVFLMLLLAVSAPGALASDWRVQDMPQQPGPREFLFIDFASIVHGNGLLQFWTEGVLESEISAKMPQQEGTPDWKQLHDAVEAEVKAQYTPSYVEDLRGAMSNEKFMNAAASITLMEAVVTELRPNVRYKMFTEIDCLNRQTRNTVIHTYRDDGTLKNSGNFPDAPGLTQAAQHALAVFRNTPWGREAPHPRACPPPRHRPAAIVVAAASRESRSCAAAQNVLK
jgi:hypothetical protein